MRKISAGETSAIAAVILAAGRGERMGGPKALLVWDHEPLAHAHARAALAAGAARVWVVARAAVIEAAPALPEGAQWCLSREDESLGPAGSLRAAMRAIDPQFQWIAVSPVDVDPAAWSCLGALARGAAEQEGSRPRVGARRGHPILARSEVLRPYATGEARALREVLRGRGESIAEVNVTEAAVLTNIDTPEALAAVRARDVRRDRP